MGTVLLAQPRRNDGYLRSDDIYSRGAYHFADDGRIFLRNCRISHKRHRRKLRFYISVHEAQLLHIRLSDNVFNHAYGLDRHIDADDPFARAGKTPP